MTALARTARIAPSYIRIYRATRAKSGSAVRPKSLVYRLDQARRRHTPTLDAGRSVGAPEHPDVGVGAITASAPSALSIDVIVDRRRRQPQDSTTKVS